MCKIQEPSDQKKDYRPKYELQDIFRLYGDDYIAKHKLNSMQLKAIRDISVCRTSAMGYNAKECNSEGDKYMGVVKGTGKYKYTTVLGSSKTVPEGKVMSLQKQ